MDEKDILLKLGKVSSIDTSAYSESTIKSTMSHFRLLLLNGINIESKEELAQVDVNKLRNKKNNLLQTELKYQILQSIQRVTKINMHAKNVIKDRGQLYSTNKNRVEDPDYMKSLKILIDKAAEIVRNVFVNQEIHDIGLYNCSLCILITLATMMRVDELVNLKIEHLSNIRNQQPVFIKVKHHKVSNPRQFILGELLVMLTNVIEDQRQYVGNYFQKQSFTRDTESQKKKFSDDYVIVVSKSYMRSKLKFMAASCGFTVRTQGFNIFRKYMTTMLTENGQHILAQQLNNHKSVNTTLVNYYVQTAEASEKALSFLPQQLDTDIEMSDISVLTPPPSVMPM